MMLPIVAVVLAGILIGILEIILRVVGDAHQVTRFYLYRVRAWLYALISAVVYVKTMDWSQKYAEYNPETRQRFTALIKTNDHAAVLAAAVPLLAQLNTNLLLIRAEDMQQKLPATIMQMKPDFVRVRTNELDIVFKDTRGKYGFSVSATSNEWILAWYEHETLLTLQDLVAHRLAAQPVIH